MEICGVSGAGFSRRHYRLEACATSGEAANAAGSRQFARKVFYFGIAQGQPVIGFSAGRGHGALDDVEPVHIQPVALPAPR